MHRLTVDRRYRVSIAKISVVVAAACGSAHAQNAQAEALFNDAEKLLDAGKVAEACDAFEASNKIESRAGTMVRLGQCREQNHQLASAWSAYKGALNRVKDPAKRSFALARSTELEPKLSTITISIPEDRRVTGLAITRNGTVVDPTLWNRVVPSDGGDNVIIATAPGHEQWKSTVAVPIDRGKIVVEIPRLTPLKVATTAPPSEPPTGTLTFRRKVAIGGAVTATASLTVGIVLGVLAKKRESNAFTLCPDPDVPCEHAERAHSLTVSGHRLAIAADVLFGAAGGLAIGAAILWLTGAPKGAPAVAIIPTTTGIEIVGRY